MPLVVDASVALAWLFADEFTQTAQTLLERSMAQGAVVPSHWSLETANAALMGERRARVTVAQTERWLALLAALPITVDRENIDHAHQRLLPIARGHGLTLYDAAYLDVASRHALPLATFDKALARAAVARDIAILGD